MTARRTAPSGGCGVDGGLGVQIDGSLLMGDLYVKVAKCRFVVPLERRGFSWLDLVAVRISI